MRKMISGADQEALKRLKNNIVVNESGTQIEVGGNVAFEDISSVGVKEVNEDTGFKINPLQLNIEDYSTAQKIATGITTIPFEYFEDSPTITGVSYQDGDMYALQQSSDVIIFEVKDGDRYYFEYITIGSPIVRNVANGTLVSSLDGLVANPPEEVFVPFMQILKNGEWNINHKPTIALPPAGFIAIVIDSEDDYTGIFMSDDVDWVTLGER